MLEDEVREALESDPEGFAGIEYRDAVLFIANGVRDPGITMKEVRELLPQYERDEIHRAMFVLNGRMIRPSGKQGTINKWQVVR